MFGNILYAEDSKDYASIANSLVEHSDNMSTEMSEEMEDMTNNNTVIVNEMSVVKRANMETVKGRITEAIERGEKLYSYEEILNLSKEDVNISDADLEYIKSSIKTMTLEMGAIYKEFVSMGKENHIVAVGIKDVLDMKFPLSMIYVDENYAKLDGCISGTGWPSCLSENGWGYKNFINSDCFWALALMGYCVTSSWCIDYVRNCSYLIGHSRYWHTH